MSVQAITWAFGQDLDSSAVKFVLVTLANYANSAGECFPGVTRLSRDTGLDERTVQRALGKLVKLGLIVRVARYRKGGGRTSDRCVLSGFPGRLPFMDDEP